MTSRTLPESTVLAPRDPSTAGNTDEWPVFELTDVNVIDPAKSSRHPTSLLNAAAYNPLTVIGRLRPLSKDLTHLFLLPRPHVSLAIEVSDVRLFSYGAYRDGTIGLWAGGKAGWYHITPSTAYKSTFKEMIEAVNLLYFIADTYAAPQSIVKGADASSTPDSSAPQIFDKYASELMRGGATAADAAEKVYLHRGFLLSSMITGKEGLSWSKFPLYGHLKRRFPEDWEAARQRVFGGSGETLGPRGAGTGRLRQASIDSTSTTSSLKRKRGRPFKSKPVDAVPSSLASTSAEKNPVKVHNARNVEKSSTPDSQSRATRKRKPAGPSPDVKTPETRAGPFSEQDDDDSDSDTRSYPRKAKSALRPKTNKPMKGPPRSRKLLVANDDEELTSETSAAPAKARSRALTSAQGDFDEGISMPTSPSSTSQPDPGGGDDEAIAGASHPDLAIRTAHVPDPVQEDTWVCAIAGCTHKVYAASTPESQKLVKQHYALHACDDDERVQLVKRLQAPSLPAGRLMERVKMQAQVEGFPGSRLAGSRYPEMLQRKY